MIFISSNLDALSGLYRCYIGCLQTFGPIFNREFDLLAFFQSPVTIGLYCRKVDEYVIAVLTSDEAIPFCGVKPFYGS